MNMNWEEKTLKFSSEEDLKDLTLLSKITTNLTLQVFKPLQMIPLILLSKNKVKVE